MSPWRLGRVIVLLPGTATLVVPALILLFGEGPNIGWGLDGVLAALPVLVALALIVAGLALAVWTTRLFVRIGQGTPAPWDPPRRLVVEGPYRRVRNPMISAVLAILTGEAVLFGSPALAVWCAVFLAMNSIWFVVSYFTGWPGFEVPAEETTMVAVAARLTVCAIDPELAAKLASPW